MTILPQECIFIRRYTIVASTVVYQANPSTVSTGTPHGCQFQFWPLHFFFSSPFMAWQSRGGWLKALGPAPAWEI